MPTVIVPSASPAPQRIGYENLFQDEDATVTASSEVAGFEMENGFDWLPFTYWKPSAVGEQWLKAVFSGAKQVNYFACYAHNLPVNSGLIRLQYSVDAGASWLNAFADLMPSTTAPIYKTFDTISASHWRVRMSNAVAANYVGVLTFGMDMPLQRGQWVGFSPPVLARETKISSNRSQDNTFLGRSIIRKGSEFSLDLDFLTPAWIRSDWFPFVLHAECKPFFVQWNEDDYPDEAAFCAVDGEIEKPKYSRRAYMSAGLKMTANVE